MIILLKPQLNIMIEFNITEEIKRARKKVFITLYFPAFLVLIALEYDPADNQPQTEGKFLFRSVITIWTIILITIVLFIAYHLGFFPWWRGFYFI